MQKLNNFNRISLDSNIFIYYLDRNSEFYSQSKKLLTQLISGNLKATTQVPSKLTKQTEKYFSKIPNISLQEVNIEIAKLAAQIRRQEGFKFVDVVQLATAVFTESKAFITNDTRLKKFKRVKVLLLSEINF